MEQFYLIVDAIRKGPLSLEQIMQMPLSPMDFIWDADTQEWKSVLQAEALESKFSPVVQVSDGQTGLTKPRDPQPFNS